MNRARSSSPDRLRLLLGAAAILALLVMPIAFAAAAGGPEATSSASVTKQVKKLKGRIATLEAAVAALQAKPTPSAPTTLPPSGPAGGDLTGTYPNPTIGPDAVTGPKVLANSLTGDDILNTSLSGASELALDSVGSPQIGPDAVGSSELNEGAITSCDSPAMQNGWAFIDVSATSTTFTQNGVSPQFNCSGGTVEARRVGEGNYRVRFNGMGSILALGVVRADGGGADNFVSIASVNDGGAAFHVAITDDGGTAEDEDFTILAL